MPPKSNRGKRSRDDDWSSEDSESSEFESVGPSSTLHHLANVADFAGVPTSFADAAYTSDIDWTPRRLLRRKNPIPPLSPAVHPDDDRAEIVLLNAIDDGDLKTLKTLLAAHKKATARSKNKLDLEFQPTGENGVTALLLAVEKENEEIVRLLVDAGSNVNTANHSGWSPLLAAVDKGNIVLAKWFESVGASLTQCVCGGFSLLHIAARAPGDHVEYVKYLMTKTPLRKYNGKRDSDTMTPLGNAAQGGNLKVCKYLRDLEGDDSGYGSRRDRDDFDDADEDEEDEESFDEFEGEPIKTPLHCAAEKGHYEVVDYLLETTDDHLVEGELEVFVTDDNDQTPLHLAVIGGHERVVQLLMEADSDPNRVDIIGLTALHYAAAHATKSVELVRALLCRADEDLDFVVWPIDVKIRSGSGVRGKTAAELARERGNIAAANLIESHAQRRGRKGRSSWY